MDHCGVAILICNCRGFGSVEQEEEATAVKPPYQHFWNDLLCSIPYFVRALPTGSPAPRSAIAACLAKRSLEASRVQTAFRSDTPSLTLCVTRTIERYLCKIHSLLANSTVFLSVEMLSLYLTILFTFSLASCSRPHQNRTENFRESLHDGRRMCVAKLT